MSSQLESYLQKAEDQNIPNNQQNISGEEEEDMYSTHRIRQEKC